MPHTERLRTAYARLAETYAEQRGRFDLAPVIEDLWTHLPAPPGDLLDLGCGAGEPLARVFLERGWRVTGVDFCPPMLALAARLVPEMTRVAGDMRRVDFPPASFDAVTAIYSLFHIPWPEHPALFARIAAWLRPGGCLFFTYATRAYTGAVEFSGDLTFMGHPLFYSHTTPDRLRAQLTAAGLQWEDGTERRIGGETFLWVRARRPDDRGTPGG